MRRKKPAQDEKKKMNKDKKFFDKVLLVLIPLALLTVALVAVSLNSRDGSSLAESSQQDILRQQDYLGKATRLSNSGQDFLAQEATQLNEVADYSAFITLREELSAAIEDLPASSCLQVKDGEQEIFTHNARIGLYPASGHKLKTALAALLELGPDFRYKTQVKAFSEPVNGRIPGSLYLIGSGDPFLWTQDYYESENAVADDIIYTPLDELADKVAARGIKEIGGAVVVIENHYDDVRYPPNWQTGNRSPSISSSLSALTVNRGTELERLELDFEGEVLSGDGTNSQPATLFETELTWIPSNKGSARAAGAVFDDLLEARGVTIPSAPFISSSSPPIVIAEIESPPLKAILQNMLSLSENAAAELITKEIGFQHSGAGTTEAGLEGIVEQLITAGILEANTTLLPADGSGVSRINRSTCRELIAVLEYKTDESQNPLIDLLAISGSRGTLREWIETSTTIKKVSAKSGTLSGVASLTGFVSTADFGLETTEHNRVLTFSYISNDTLSQIFRRSERPMFEEKITLAMLEYLS